MLRPCLGRKGKTKKRSEEHVVVRINCYLSQEFRTLTIEHTRAGVICDESKYVDLGAPATSDGSNLPFEVPTFGVPAFYLEHIVRNGNRDSMCHIPYD